MLSEFISTIKLRVIAVFVLVHAGLVLGIFALARNAALNNWDQTSWVFLSAIACLYFGFFMGVFFIVWPLLPWLKRAQKAQTWIERCVQELPHLIEHLPKIIAIVQAIRAAWKNPEQKS